MIDPGRVDLYGVYGVHEVRGETNTTLEMG